VIVVKTLQLTLPFKANAVKKLSLASGE